MQNWSGNQRWQPAHLACPKSEAEVIDLVRKVAARGGRLRPIGAGHSFMPLSATDDVTVDIGHLSGIIDAGWEEHIREGNTRPDAWVRVRAGTTLSELNEALHARGLALRNLGDIDTQTVAGAISTGTHGTGSRFANLSAEVISLRFVDSHGRLTVVGQDQSELLRAARLSLGLLGIITEVTLRCVASYDLDLKVSKTRLEDVLDGFPANERALRNFEFYWFPHTRYVMTKRVREARDEGLIRASRRINYVNDILLENYAFRTVCELSRRLPRLTPRLSRLTAALVSPHRKVAHAHWIYATPRLVRFNEMEYAVPYEAFPEVMRAVAKRVNTWHQHVFFPLECRFVAADDSLLSPTYRRKSVYIACHVYHKKEYLPYLDDLQDIFRDYDGRPHWGKWHSLGREDIEALYPALPAFEQLRAVHDPYGMFLSPQMAELFGRVAVN